MTIVAVIGYILVAFALLGAIYSSYTLCQARKKGRDTRPFMFSVFSLLAFALLNFFWVLTGYSNQLEPSFKILWLVVYFLFIINICWLTHSLGVRKR